MGRKSRRQGLELVEHPCCLLFVFAEGDMERKKVTTIRLPAGVLEELQEYAAARDLSASAVVRMAVRRFLNTENPPSRTPSAAEVNRSRERILGPKREIA